MFRSALGVQGKHASRRWLAAGAVTGSLAVGYYTNDTLHDFMRHSYLVGKRVSIVGYATVRCFYNYHNTLSTDFSSKEERFKALSECHQRCADLTLWALEKNGGIYIKLGQHISAMTYLLPSEWTETMVPLQDKCPESTVEEIDAMFKHDLGVSIDERFSEFTSKPIGVASLAQVHVAKLKGSNKSVAVKCQHPSLKEFVPLDILMTQNVFKLIDYFFPEYPLEWLGEELQSSIYVELDFVNEAKNAEKTAQYFQKFQRQTALRIPEVISATKRILIMEYIEGSRLDDIKYLDEHHISRSEVSSCLSHIFNNMIFTPGVSVHCDPHGGNIAIRPRQKDSNPDNNHNFEIILYDHGLYRDVPIKMRRNYAHFWLALLARNQKDMQKYAKLFANISEDEFPLFAAALTGRDIDTALNLDISKTRSQQEIDNMKSAIVQGEILTTLMSILSKVPRVVILILKTNDLTRHLDETLQNPLGPERTFLILSQYCSKTVYEEDKENARKSSNWIIRLWKLTFSWLKYTDRFSKLYVYDTAMYFKNLI